MASQRATCTSEEIENFIKAHRENKIPFLDDSFPPFHDESLFMNNRPENLKGKKIIWNIPKYIKVPTEDNDLEWVVYRNPSYHDIKQGILGDCWLLSALAVIVEKPKLLDNILITKAYNREGIYLIRLCHSGEWKTVILDEYFPCDESNSLLYAKAVRKQLWVILIEKAYAKLSGCYQAIISGTVFEALAILTGYTCEILNISKASDFEYIWAKLLSVKDAGFLMGASSNNSDENLSSFGLVGNHAYSILDLKQYKDNRLIKMRNPWGNLSWNGRWSSRSSEWTPELWKDLNGFSNINLTDDGIFWMEFRDFTKYFNQISICKIRNDWKVYRFSGTFARQNSNHVNVYRLKVLEKCNVELCLFLKNTTNRRQSNDCDLVILVYRKENSNYTLIMRTNHSVKKFISKEDFLMSGEYLIVPLSFNFWHSNNNWSFDFNMVIYASSEVFVEKNEISASVLSDLLFKLCFNHGERINIQNQNVNIYSLTKNFNGLIVVAENRTNSTYIIKVDASRSLNIGSTRGSLNTKDALKPNHKQLLLILTRLNRENYDCNYRINYELESLFVSRKHEPEIKEPIHFPVRL